MSRICGHLIHFAEAAMKVTILVVMSAVLGGSALSFSQEDDATKEAIALVRKAEGKVTIDPDRPGKPVVAVDI